MLSVAYFYIETCNHNAIFPPTSAEAIFKTAFYSFHHTVCSRVVRNSFNMFDVIKLKLFFKFTASELRSIISKYFFGKTKTSKQVFLPTNNME